MKTYIALGFVFALALTGCHKDPGEEGHGNPIINPMAGTPAPVIPPAPVTPPSVSTGTVKDSGCGGFLEPACYTQHQVTPPPFYPPWVYGAAQSNTNG